MNEKIIFQIEISFTDDKGKHVVLKTYAGTAEKLLKRTQEVLSKESKWSILKLFNFKVQ